MNLRFFLFLEILKELKNLKFLICSQNHIYAFYLRNFCGTKLRITTRNHYKSIRICPKRLSDSFSAFYLRLLGNSTCIDNGNIGRRTKIYGFKAVGSKITCHRACFGKIELTAKRMEGNFHKSFIFLKFTTLKALFYTFENQNSKLKINDKL